MRRKSRSRREWLEICEASYASGETLAAFAERMEVNASTLAWWRSVLRDELQPTVDRPAFVEVSSVDTESSAGMTLQVGSARLHFAALPPAEWVGKLLSSC